ncbi:MAG: hypothetical protein HS126_01805 [Anaerolineales bacterium]|nr:hypothetical protein [Anaerolineales bacterium]
MLKPHKIHFILTLSLILLLALVAAAHAAPPSPDGSSLGDSLNLDENGNPVDEVDDTGGNNLGTVMSDKTGDTIDDGTTDEETTDDGTAGDDTGDDTTDDGTTDDGTTGEVAKQHPVGSALADYFDVDYEEIMTLHDAGTGFGNIAKAYFFADQLGLTPQDLLLEAHTSGWGNVLKQNGIHPGAVGNGGGKKSEVTGPENSTLEPQNNGASGLTGPGGQGGNGHGNGGGNGHGNGNGGGNGGGKGHGGGNGNGHGNK